MVEVVSGFIKKIQGLSAMLVFSQISQNCFCIKKVMDQDYGSRDHDWLSVHGGLATMEQRGHSGAQEVVVITQREREREREEAVGVLINGATWSRSYRDSHTTALNRGGRWCFNGEMVPDVRMRD
jgi:hypothetical protein